ncbi:VCBS repeat-containing protein [Jiulongibacter sediminis]|uniref:VCBS repeat-containing protein n=1 Tax=Jiulongibacter sediminis TaxID=1605367 RepID=UPI0026EF062D|nr:VCBS repeat-containing protein [Jiulongibacter sediminis]
MQKPLSIITPVFLFLFLSGLSSCDRSGGGSEKNTDEGEKLFTLLYPTHTNINFQNSLTEGLNTNILMYEYFYNGGGVAAADFNGDGLEDLYFTANMSENKLYQNNGDFRFQDITGIAGVGGRPGPWKTGVSVVDINADGKMDIYLCYSGALPPQKRVNQLFVNQGNNDQGVPQFKEAAEEYGLASAGYSNQAYFFDADLDGDLDMLLLNHNPKNLPILNEAGTRQLMAKDDPEMGLRYFRNEKGFFKDVTIQSGINGSALSYGLGLGISDFNQDGLPDFYVSNDYSVPDYLYFNLGGGRFKNQLEESLRHTSQFSMGNDVADYNNDGLTDIFTLDMLPEDNKRQKLLLAPDNWNKFDLNLRSGFYYQYMRNMLQQNNGDGTFSEIGQQMGVSNTDWSWSALLADYNNDGYKDLFISNGYFRDYTNLDFIKYMDDFVKEKGRLQREDVLEIIKQMPSSNVVNYAFENQNGKGFTNKTAEWGVGEVANSNGAAYTDLDNDGDLDLVVNNINKAAFVFKNESKSNYLKIKFKGSEKNPDGLGAAVEIRSSAGMQRLEQNPYRGYLSTMSKELIFGLGDQKQIDELMVQWPDGKTQRLASVKANQVIELDYKNASEKVKGEKDNQRLFEEVKAPSFEHQNRTIRDYDRQSLLINELSFSGPALAKADVNGDGLEDIFVGGNAGQSSTIIYQNASGGFTSNSDSFKADTNSSDEIAAFADVDGDGDFDLYVGSGGYHDFKKDDKTLQDRLYLNDGKGNFTKSSGLPEMLTSTGAVAFSDINGDGAQDIFVGGRVIPGGYPESPRSYILINDGKGSFTDKTLDFNQELGYIGMVSTAQWADLNADGSKELILAGEWMPLSVFELKAGKLENQTQKYFGKELNGWWNTFEIADLNKDGLPDIIAGNMGLNTQFKVREKEPLELYFDDFDENGSIDPLFNFYIQGKSYPYLTRDELVNQIPKFKTQFNTFESYSTVGLDKFLTLTQIEKAGRIEANFMETAVFLNQKGGTFSKVTLPSQAQYSPVYSIQVLDADKDGDQDILLFGNNSHTKLRFGKFDANYGVLLRGDGKGGFEYASQSDSGFSVRGDVRSSVLLKDYLILGINGKSLKAYKNIEKQQNI